MLVYLSIGADHSHLRLGRLRLFKALRPIHSNIFLSGCESLPIEGRRAKFLIYRTDVSVLEYRLDSSHLLDRPNPYAN